MNFCVYILFSKKLNRYYVGTTNNFTKRLSEHNMGFYNDSFTAKGIPWKEYLVINELNSKQAFKIELHIKTMKSRKYIENLAKYPELLAKLKDQYS